MGDTDEPSIRSVKSKATWLGLGRIKVKDTGPALPTHDPHAAVARDDLGPLHGSSSTSEPSEKHNGDSINNPSTAGQHTLNTAPDGETASALAPRKRLSLARIKDGSIRFLKHTKNALTHSYINVMLVFVPIGIAAKLAHLKPEIVFSMNAIAIIPLAGLLAHATEVVAARVGDALGALLNVSFGNAVELILFIILLASGQIEVVQASLLGSILANLLLILGMAFLLGGLKYQEQVYNSTATQMSGVMLALAVMSLLLPTAFHSAFNDNDIADHETLIVSRITSIILLLVYGLYLLFQLKSHRYLYASTPQHIIDEESHPGVLADVFDSSSSSSSSSSNTSDSDDSSHSSNGTMKNKAKRMVKRLRRKSSSSSGSRVGQTLSPPGSPSAEPHTSPFDTERNGSVMTATLEAPLTSRQHSLNPIMSGDEADDDAYAPKTRDFEVASSASAPHTKREKHKHKYESKKHNKRDTRNRNKELAVQTAAPKPKVAFAEEIQQNDITSTNTRRPYRPAFSSLLSNNVFSNPQNAQPVGPVPNIRIAARTPLRRARSLPERMNPDQLQSTSSNLPAVSPQAAMALNEDDEDEDVPEMSIKAAIFMLLISTGLVAVCADFMSEAIEPMVESSGISQAFIGLIIIPIVGNAAEHVTAVVVAMKNKMDLAIGIAVGSSIQIALFITPLIVILGWIMNKDMTLYFNIFETVALFVTVLVVNFLVLDGRSNYLEGSLLIAAYTIIAVVSYYYPDGCDASAIGGRICGSNSVAHSVAPVIKRMARL
ncbi:Sodium/calcium exchanger protein-domain-containing protein [Ampelomyces quisqualis]|uniref:Sodium/calcium exchanger protein-domain-containing protein n=1 Tax=Ampelomyces quisqualis TaxID=50730 RepID=A0A6A5QU16_AMPQU|nr:Sodium/calcium exchanger protein-domain-containing protein [Ampelomyces quisqualis]